MRRQEIINGIYSGADGRQALYDLTIPEQYNGELIIFIHGFMGYKDWGCWNLLQNFFTSKGFAFIKYNVSHNGTTPKNPIDLVDKEAFGNNTYSREVEDLGSILELIPDHFDSKPLITLIGHSRGGGIALLFSRDERITRIISLAGISSIAKRFPKGDELEDWQKNGIRSVHNSRIGQDLPLYYSQFEDYIQHRKRLNIEYHCRTSSKPTCIIHGEKDESVSIEEGEQLAEWTQTELIRIQGAGHTFGASEPWSRSELPKELETVALKCLEFISKPIDLERNENISSIIELIKLAKADDDLIQQEFDFIHKLAQLMGLSTDDFGQIFDRYIGFTPPPLEFDRILQFQRLVLLMHIDEKVDPRELNRIQTIAIRMGLNSEATDSIIRFHIENPGKTMSPERLLELFKLHHN